MVLQSSTVASAYWALVGFVVVFCLYKVLSYGMRTKDFPPGPPTFPIVGNMLQMPTKNFHTGLQKFAYKYGPIVGLKLGGQNMILLNSPEVFRDLIEKRSAIYALRPDLYIREFDEGMNIGLRENDNIWRRQRKMYNIRLNVTTANNYLPYQVFESLQLLNDMAEDPSKWVGHLQRYSASIATTVLYGFRTPNVNTGYVRGLMHWVETTSAAINLQLVDFFPFLRPWYQMAPAWLIPFKAVLRDIRILENRVFFELLELVKDKMKSGRVYPSFVRDMLMDKDDDRLDERYIAHNGAHGFGAGMDTTWNTSLGFVKAMLLNPEVVRCAQKEIDDVIGPDRMPSWEDRANLPYIRGVLAETLRWAPSPISGAIPRCVARDDVYNGMTIPKGSTVMMNIWSLNHNHHERPREFDPLRHDAEKSLNENFAISPDSTIRPHFTFGGGRRVCPGFHVADRSLFLAISRMLWAFDFHRATDHAGNLLPIDQDAISPETGMIVRPAAFEADIRPRSQQKVALIKQAWKEAKTQLDAEGNFNEEYFDKFLRGKK